MTEITVTAAVVQRAGKILAARKKPGTHLAGFWEFPGGKLEQDETPKDCLARELREELNIEVEIGPFFTESCYDYGIKKIRLLCYFADFVSGELTLSDHDRVQWLPTAQLATLTWAPADLPIVEKLVQLTER